jgi:hypothetical protein
VRGTPVLTANVAVWQGDRVETKMRELGNAGSALSVAANAELPAATYVNNELFVTYIVTDKTKRSIWLTRAAL